MSVIQRSLPELGAEGILNAIFRGEISLGQRLVETELAELLGISRAPVRESLRILEASGIIERSPRQGARVLDPSPDQAFEIITFREGLEVMAINHFYRYVFDGGFDRTATQSKLEDLRDVTAGEAPLQKLIDASFSFHAAVVDLSGNRKISETYKNIILQVKICMMKNIESSRSEETPEENFRRHEILLEKIFSGDRGAAVAAVREHGHDRFLRAKQINH